MIGFLCPVLPSANTFLIWSTSSRSIQTTLQSSLLPTHQLYIFPEALLYSGVYRSIFNSVLVKHIWRCLAFIYNQQIWDKHFCTGWYKVFLYKLNSVTVSIAIKYSYKFICHFQHWAKSSLFYSANITQSQLHYACTVWGRTLQKTGKKWPLIEILSHISM